MRLLWVTPWWPASSADFRGSFVRDQALALREIGHEVDVIVIGPTRPAPDPAVTWLPFRWLPRYMLHGFEADAVAALLRKQRRFRPADYDLIHAHGETCGVAVGQANPCGTPLIVTIHGATTNARAHRSRRRRKSIEQLATAATIVVVGKAQALIWANANPRVVPNGFDSGLFQPSAFPPPPLRVVSLSNLEPTKGIQTTIEALALSREAGTQVSLLVVGSGSHRGALQDLVAKLRLEPQVRFAGGLSRPETAAAIASSHLLCLPSVSEAFGIVYLEALGSGRPAIGCVGQGAEDVIQHGVDGWLVAPHDAPSVARSLQEAALSPDKIAQMGTAGAGRIRRDFTWKRSAEQLIKAYDVARR